MAAFTQQISLRDFYSQNRGPFWQHNAPDERADFSFSACHARHLIPPPPVLRISSSKSCTLHKVNPDEIESARSLESLKLRDFGELTLPDGRDFHWAADILNLLGPSFGSAHDFRPPPDSYLLDTNHITCEGDVGVHTDMFQWNRIKYSGELLFLLTRFDVYSLPQSSSKVLLHTVTSGDSGRTDRMFSYPESQVDSRTPQTVNRGVLMVELKPSSVCGSILAPDDRRKVNLLEQLHSFLGTHGEFEIVREFPSKPSQTGDWRKKASEMVHQLWNQSVSRQITHLIFSTELQFMMCLRDGNTLWVSKPFQWYSLEIQKRKDVFVQTSVFLAHALHTHFPDGPDGPYRLHSAPKPLSRYIGQDEPPSEGPSGDGANDTQDTSEESNSKSQSTQGMTFRGFVSQLLQTALPSIAGRLVFCTTGVPTLPYRLTTLWRPRYTLKTRHRTLFVMEKSSESTESCSIYRGIFDGQKVFIKMVKDDEDAIQSMVREFSFYQALSSLQGTVIPKCLGLYLWEGTTYLLVTRDCGSSLNSFDELSTVQSRLLAQGLRKIHALGVCHNDLAPRNVVKDEKGNCTILDFGLGESHRCDGACNEIVGFKAELFS